MDYEKMTNADAARNAKIVADNMNEWRSLGSFPMPTPDKDNPNILIAGRWLERGGTSWIISTAGTGKTTFATQLAICAAEGREFLGLKPCGKFNILVIQSEDSDDRVGIDREDILAYLTAEHPEIDWSEAVNLRVHFAGYDGKVGAAFINELDADIKKSNPRPDIIIINPLYDRVGADTSKGEIVTAFLAGGMINGVTSIGLRAVARKYGIGVIVFAHTGKPPQAQELKQWLTSDMPEYQVCGSSVITNFGRSFITMMKIPSQDGYFLFTAGKNGDGLGWRQSNGDYTRRHFAAWGDGVSSCGHGRAHYWRDVTEDEQVELEREVLGIKPDEPSKRDHDNGTDKNAEYLAELIRNGINAGAKPYTNDTIRKWAEKWWTKNVARKAVKKFEDVSEKRFHIGKENGVYVLL